MGGQYGTKELNEALEALCTGGAFAFKRLHDGVDLSDGWAIGKKLLEKDFRNTMVQGAQGLDKLGKEVSELDQDDIDGLVEHFREHCLPHILDVWKQVQAERKDS